MALVNVIETLSLQEALVLPSTVELKALASDGEKEQRRVDGEFRIVKVPADDFPPCLYVYRTELDLDELAPGIIVPDDGVGVWIAENPVVLSTSIPVDPPPLRNLEWQANLLTPNRLVRYKSLALSTPAVVEDWSPIREAIAIVGVPSFAPDYPGELVVDTDTGNFYRATGVTADPSSWSLI